MVGLAKRALYKTIGRANVRWGELREVILDVEDDVQLPILTPNAMMFGQPNILPEEDASPIEYPPFLDAKMHCGPIGPMNTCVVSGRGTIYVEEKKLTSRRDKS